MIPSHNSWADALHAATTPDEKVKILLNRAKQRTSKKLIEQDINEALQIMGSKETAQELLQRLNLQYTQMMLHSLSIYLLREIDKIDNSK